MTKIAPTPAIIPIMAALFVVLIVALIVKACRMEAAARRDERNRAQAIQQALDNKALQHAATRKAPASSAPKRKPGRPRKERRDDISSAPIATAANQIPPAPAPTAACPSPADIRTAILARGNGAFAGQVVAFTGELEGMPRAVAINRVIANGGRAYKDIVRDTTMLVVADELTRKGSNTGKLDKADKRADQIRKITESQFKFMLSNPIDITLDEFAAIIAAQE